MSTLLSIPPRELSPSQLSRAMALVSAESSRICDEFIAAGRGHELPHETRHKTDPLSLRCIACWDQYSTLRSERDRRMTYSGSLRRTA
jgi:hypothetical protein